MGVPDPVQECRQKALDAYAAEWAAAWAQYSIDWAACNGDEACEANAETKRIERIDAAYHKFQKQWDACGAKGP